MNRYRAESVGYKFFEKLKSVCNLDPNPDFPFLSDERPQPAFFIPDLSSYKKKHDRRNLVLKSDTSSKEELIARGYKTRANPANKVREDMHISLQRKTKQELKSLGIECQESLEAFLSPRVLRKIKEYPVPG